MPRRKATVHSTAAHLAISHHCRLDLYSDSRPLLSIRYPVVMFIARSNCKIVSVGRKCEARYFIGEPGVLLHSLLGDMVPDGDSSVGPSRGERVVAKIGKAKVESGIQNGERGKRVLASDDKPMR